MGAGTLAQELLVRVRDCTRPAVILLNLGRLSLRFQAHPQHWQTLLPDGVRKTAESKA